MRARRLVLHAPAKVNLALAVLGARADGYHEIDTVMMGLALGDVLTAEEIDSEACALALHGPAADGVPADASNLAVRAARAVGALARARGLRAPGVRLVLEKRIPAAAGLGGGSSDAAAAALACARLYGLDADDPALLEALAGLGSDCAFFLAARASGLARCTGRGERVEALPELALPWSLVLLTPPFGCASAEVYRALRSLPLPPRRARSGGRPFDPHALGSCSLEEARGRLRNELEPAALRVRPELEVFRSSLEEHAPGVFRLAGSGSSWFGFFPDEGTARAMLARLEADFEGRRYALRGRWVLPAVSRGMESAISKTQ